MSGVHDGGNIKFSFDLFAEDFDFRGFQNSNGFEDICIRPFGVLSIPHIGALPESVGTIMQGAEGVDAGGVQRQAEKVFSRRHVGNVEGIGRESDLSDLASVQFGADDGAGKEIGDDPDISAG